MDIMTLAPPTSAPVKNGKDPVLEALHRIEVRLQSVEELTEEVLDKLSDLSPAFGSGFSID